MRKDKARHFWRVFAYRCPHLLGMLIGLYAIAFTYLSTCQLTHERRLRDVERLLTIALLDAESGQRAYLLTSEPLFLDQYRAGLKGVAVYRPVYERMLIDQESKRIYGDLSSLLEDKLAEMASTIQAHNTAQPNRAIQIVANRIGHQYTEQIYYNLRRIRTIEADRVAPFEIWNAPHEVDIHDPERVVSPSALLMRIAAAAQ